MNAKGFSPWNPKNEHRAYYMGHNVIYDMARDYFNEKEKNEPLVHIRGRAPLSEDYAKASGRSPWFDYPEYYFPLFYSGRGGAGKALNTRCESWFFRNCERMIRGMFNCYGFHDIGKAIAGTKDYKELCNLWDAWFERKRERFMEKMSAEIMQIKGVPARMPASHGGIANLLKCHPSNYKLPLSSDYPNPKVMPGCIWFLSFLLPMITYESPVPKIVMEKASECLVLGDLLF